MRIALGIEYDGTAFAGWQRQENGRTIQAVAEAAVSRVADHPVVLHCAGRTDAGVHAYEQVVHFDTIRGRGLRNWVLGANVNLPRDVTVRWARFVPDTFHARFSAVARRYCYRIVNRPVRLALDRSRAAWVHSPLDFSRMHEGAEALLGRHDFSAFRAAGCQAKTPIREIYDIHLEKRGALICLEVEANAFLHHMVRNIAGSLIAVGQGRHKPGWVTEILASRDRRRAGPTAPAQGLALRAIRYPSQFPLPTKGEPPWLDQ